LVVADSSATTSIGWIPVTTLRWWAARPRSARQSWSAPVGGGDEPVAGDEPAVPTAQTMAQQCRPYVHPLWLFAWFTCGDPAAAEEVTVNAVVETRTDPAAPTRGPTSAWSALVSNVERRCDDLIGSGSPRTAPSVEQREAVALVLAGRTARDVASLLGVPPMQVYRALNGGLHALRQYLPSADHDNGSAAAHLASPPAPS